LHFCFQHITAANRDHGSAGIGALVLDRFPFVSGNYCSLPVRWLTLPAERKVDGHAQVASNPQECFPGFESPGRALRAVRR
jgi:hypothetical protein